MSVMILTQNTLEPTLVPGDLLELTQNLNLASAKGMDFAIVVDHDDNKVALRVDSITVMKEYDDDVSIFR